MARKQAGTLLVAAAAALSAVPSHPAQAQTAAWSITGAGCVPTGQTAANPGTFNSAGDVRFPAGRLGEIILICPVPATVGRANNLSVTYRDTDGPGTVVQLRAVLRRKALETGAVSDFGGTGFDSNGSAAASGNVRRGAGLGNCLQGVTFDHANFTFYVQVNMTKRLSAQDVLLASVQIGTNPSCQ